MALLEHHHHSLEKYVGTGYKKANNPHVLRSNSYDYRRDGLNCQTLIHVLYRELLGITLPVGLWSSELFTDSVFFEKVERTSSLFTKGDIFFFASESNVNEPKNYHLAYFTGLYGAGNSPLLIHAHFSRGVEVKTLESLAKIERYRHLMGIKRLKMDYRPL